MIDFDKLRKVCIQNTEVSSSVVDDFLIYYAAKQDRLDRRISQEFAKYKHIFRSMQSEWANYLKSQYIAHSIFKENGLIHRYLKHSAIKDMPIEKQNYLKQQATTPWRFSFSVITKNKAADFYEMEDILTEETFLLYSPGITDILTDGQRLLWFNLVGYNGHCWQSFGPISGYKGFEPDDIFFFATELAPGLDEEDDIAEHIENNPVPYMMLLSGSETPLVFHKTEQTVIAIAEHEVAGLFDRISDDNFEVAAVGEVYRYRLKNWNSFPHFAEAFFDKARRTLLLSAMTDQGFLNLARQLRAEGVDIETSPDIRINPGMLPTAENILRKKIILNRYSDLFTKKTSVEEQRNQDQINRLLGLMVPDINAGKVPDVQKLAKQTGLDIEMVRSLIEQTQALVKRH